MDRDADGGFETVSGDYVLPDEGVTIGARTVALLVGFGLFVAAFAYDFRVVGGGPLIGEWNPTGTDWLFYPSLFVFGLYVVLPLAQNRERTLVYWERLRRNRLATASLVYVVGFLFVGTIGPFLVGRPTHDLTASRMPPVFTTVSAAFVTNCVGPVVDGACHGTFAYPLGTNIYGESLIALVVAGGRVAVQVVMVTGAIVIPIATAVGVVTGYYGGRVDEILMRYVDVQRTVPAFLIYLILIFVFGRSLLLLLVVFGLFNWGGVARLVRADVLQTKEEHYLLAAENAGASDLDVIRRHVLPNVSATVLSATTRQLSSLILVEAALAYLNLNDLNTPSWGESIAAGFQAHFPEMWWMTVIPVAALAGTVVAFSVLGDALSDVADPRRS